LPRCSSALAVCRIAPTARADRRASFLRPHLITRRQPPAALLRLQLKDKDKAASGGIRVGTLAEEIQEAYREAEEASDEMEEITGGPDADLTLGLTFKFIINLPRFVAAAIRYKKWSARYIWLMDRSIKRDSYSGSKWDKFLP